MRRVLAVISGLFAQQGGEFTPRSQSFLTTTVLWCSSGKRLCRAALQASLFSGLGFSSVQHNRSFRSTWVCYILQHWALLLKAAHKNNFSREIKEVTSVYKDDLNASELIIQLEVFGASFKLTDTPSTIHDVIKHLKDLSTSQHFLLEQVFQVCRLLLVLPATNAASERSFSVMRRLKSNLWSIMSQPRMNHAMVLNIYKELVDELDLCTVATEFEGSNEHRLHLFNCFLHCLIRTFNC